MGDHSRSSGEGNEDDYDYALELARDDQYRQVAQNQMPRHDQQAECGQNHVDVDIESNSIGACEDSVSLAEPEEEDMGDVMDFIMAEEISGKETEDEIDISCDKNTEFDDTKEDLDTRGEEMPTGSGGRSLLVSVDQYVNALHDLQLRQRRATTTARRSSLMFETKYASSEREVLNKLLTLLQIGLHVRRHQATFCSEVVRLFSMDGGRTIRWAPEVLRSQLNGISRFSRKNNNKPQESSLDCCIASKPFLESI
jgi:hypothetical protein